MSADDVKTRAATPSPGGVAIGERYEIRREIARGGMAIVYLAYDRALGREVALKDLAGSMIGDATLVQRFRRESELARGLSHPNVVTVFDCFESGGRPYIAMEYLPGGSLRRQLRRVRLEQIGGALEGVLAGLAHLETHGVVHRDLKPENLLVTSDGRIKITDFGIARARGALAGQLTAPGTVMGTPAYIAPEQVMGREAGLPSDLYSVGVVAYELLVGELPFQRAGWAVLLEHMHKPVPPPRERRPDLDPALERWLLRMLSKDPARRPPSAHAAWRQLEECIAASCGSAWRRSARLEHGGDAPLEPADFLAAPRALGRRPRRPACHVAPATPGRCRRAPRSL